MDKPFKINERLRSFRHAIRGIKYLIKSEHNARIHLVATVLVILLGKYLNINQLEWISITIAIVLVWVTEAINTSFELLADHVVKEYNELIGKAKDVAAGAVLISSIGSVVVGILVFVPYLISF